MTAAVLKKLLKAALKLYNCLDWDVQIAPVEAWSIDESGWQTEGCCTLNYRYLQAIIAISKELSPERRDIIIRHEAAHVLLGEVSDAVDRIIELLPERLRLHAKEIYSTAEEHTVDRLAQSSIHKRLS